MTSTWFRTAWNFNVVITATLSEGAHACCERMTYSDITLADVDRAFGVRVEPARFSAPFTGLGREAV